MDDAPFLLPADYLSEDQMTKASEARRQAKFMEDSEKLAVEIGHLLNGHTHGVALNALATMVAHITMMHSSPEDLADDFLDTVRMFQGVEELGREEGLIQ